MALASGTFFLGKQFPSSADSRRASCQLLVKELAINTGELPPGGLPRNSVAKCYCGRKSSDQTNPVEIIHFVDFSSELIIITVCVVSVYVIG